MANKKTQKDFFNEIRTILVDADRADLVEFIDGRLDALAKKTSKVSAKRAEEIDTNTNLVYDALVAVGKAITISELVKTATNGIQDWNGQKVASYIKKLIDAGKVVRTEEKKVAYFSVK